MNCPKYKAAILSVRGYVGNMNVACDEEECAWWDEVNKRCAILGIMLDLDWINQGIADLVNKMPHAGQFTK